jgi:hypothetical protein
MASSCLASLAGTALDRPQRPRCRVACSAGDAGRKEPEPAWFAAGGKNAGRLACGVLAAWVIASASNPVIAASQVGAFSLPYQIRTAGGTQFWNVALRNECF